MASFTQKLDQNSIAPQLICFLITTICVVFFIMWINIDPKSLAFYSVEDGPIENLTAVTFLISSIGFLVAAYRSEFLRAKGTKWAYFMVLSWAGLMFVFFGEEISWGQRIFDIATPEYLAKHNEQNELNIHNIAVVDQFMGGKFRYLSIMMLMTGVVLPAMALTAWGRRLFQFFSFPVCPVSLFPAFVGSYLFAKYYMDIEIIPEMHPINSIAEVRELLMGIGLAGFGIMGAMSPKAIFRSER